MSERFGQKMQSDIHDQEIMADKKLAPETPDDIESFYDDAALDEYYERRNTLLADIPQPVIKRAWANMAHLLLAENSKIIDMGCGDGEQTFIMAVLNPNMQFIGIDKNKRRINKANTLYDLHNLEFRSGDFSGSDLEPNSADAIINDGTLHSAYSNARYNENIITDLLREQSKALKAGGSLFIRDYSRPPPEQYVLLEMPDKASHSDELEDLSEADLLVWYSEHARPKQDPGTGGFS